MIARLRRFFHCLCYSWAGHRAVNIKLANGPTKFCCDCGRVFSKYEPYEKEWIFFFLGYIRGERKE